jgi:hypothetical protein
VKDSTSFSPFSFQNGRLQRNLSFQKDCLGVCKKVAWTFAKRLSGRLQKGCLGVCKKVAWAFAKGLPEHLQKGCLKRVCKKGLKRY